LLNVVQGERYLTIPDENLMYLAGHYGQPPGELDRQLLDRAFATDRGKAMLDWEPPQPSIEDIRRDYGARVSDEELLLRYLIPGTDVDAMYEAAKPIEPVYPLGGAQGLGWIKDLLASGSSKSLTASRSNITVSLSR
jgi:oxaloacetate decarboxylase alpha subunit